jgi:hypothetical protein
MEMAFTRLSPGLLRSLGDPEDLRESENRISPLFEIKRKDLPLDYDNISRRWISRNRYNIPTIS